MKKLCEISETLVLLKFCIEYSVDEGAYGIALLVNGE